MGRARVRVRVRIRVKVRITVSVRVMDNYGHVRVGVRISAKVVEVPPPAGRERCSVHPPWVAVTLAPEETLFLFRLS